MAQAKKKTAKKAAKKTTKKVTKKAPAKKAPAKKRSTATGARISDDEVRGVKPVRILSPERAQAAIETLENIVDAYRDAVCDVEDGGELSQDMLAIAAFAQRSKGVLGDICELFSVNALRLEAAGGTFQPGSFSVDFDVAKGRRTVKWQAIAVQNRKELCDALGNPFDESAYAEQCKTNTKPSADKLKPVIREAS